MHWEGCMASFQYTVQTYRKKMSLSCHSFLQEDAEDLITSARWGHWEKFLLGLWIRKSYTGLLLSYGHCDACNSTIVKCFALTILWDFNFYVEVILDLHESWKKTVPCIQCIYPASNFPQVLTDLTIIQWSNPGN